MNTASGQPIVVLFTGLPGTGKSTLAERLARAIRTPAFAGDWLMGGLKPARAAFGQLDRGQYSEAWFGLLRTLVTRQLMLDQGAIVDDVISAGQLELWQETADQFKAPLYLIECGCSDQVLHRSRIEGRARGIPGWHEVGWDHVERMRDEITPLTGDCLRVDAVDPLEDNFRRVLDYLAIG